MSEQTDLSVNERLSTAAKRMQDALVRIEAATQAVDTQLRKPKVPTLPEELYAQIDASIKQVESVLKQWPANPHDAKAQSEEDAA